MKNNKYSDKTQTEILAKVKKWTAECKMAPPYKALSQDAQDNPGSITGAFAEFMYNYHLQSPESWTAAALENVLVDIFPRKMLMPASFFTSVESALSVFFTYLKEIDALKNDKALISRLKTATPQMCRRAGDSDNFSPLKQMLMEGFEQDVDVADTDTLNDFLHAPEAAASLQAGFTCPEKIGRNEPCPCGSGKKYKKCCGLDSASETPMKNATPPGCVEPKPKEEPTLEQWGKLYEVARVIKQIAPWSFLWSNDLITIMLPGREEPVYCSVMGRSGDCYAIGIYPGYEAVMSYYRLAEMAEDEPQFIVGFEQNCLMCNYGDREEVSPRDREVLRALDLKFRGRNEWIYFRSMEPGLFPWYIDSEQADILIQTLQNLAMACKCLSTEELKADFEGGETLLRSFSPEKKLWFNAVVKTPPVPVTTDYLIIEDDLLIARLKNQKRSKQQLEFDLGYLPIPVQEHKEERPYLPRILMLADRQSGLSLDQYMVEPDEGIEDAVIGMIDEHIEKYGRPSAIYVRDERTGRYIEDLCEKVKIKLIQGQRMPVMNTIFKELLDFIG